MTMVRYFVKKSFNEDIQEVKTLPSGHAWIYGSEISDTDLHTIAQESGLDGNILRDVRDPYELPRVEYNKGATYVFVRIPRPLKGGPADSVPLLFVIRDNLFATLSMARYATPEELAQQYRFSMRSSTSVFLQVLSHVFTQYGKEIQKITGYLQKAEQRLHTREINAKDLIKFVSVETSLSEHRTNLAASKAVLSRIEENKHGLLTAKEEEFLADIELYIEQLLVAVESNASTLVSIRSTFSTISDNALNRRMKTLTVLTMFLTIPNIIFGMFGMNVKLPVNPNEVWVFAGIVAGSGVLVMLAYWMIRKYKF